MCVTVAKVGQGRPKNKDCSSCLGPAILQYERSSTVVLAQGMGVMEPENRKVDQSVLTFLCEGQGHLFHLPCKKTIPSSMTVHDNIAIGVIVSEI